MAQSSDEQGHASGSGTAASSVNDSRRDTQPIERPPLSSLRERIRQAGGAAARISEIPPQRAGEAAARPSVAPEHSGVRTRPADRQARTSAAEASSLFAERTGTLRPPPPPLGSIAPPTAAPPPPPPEAAAFAAGFGTGRTQVGFGAVRSEAPPAISAPDRAPPVDEALDLVSARTQRLPRVQTGARGEPLPPALPPSRPPRAASEPKVAGLLRSREESDAAGRYSLREVSADYVPTRSPARSTAETRVDATRLPAETDAVGATQTVSDLDDAARSRRSTPKARPGRRAKSQPAPALAVHTMHDEAQARASDGARSAQEPPAREPSGVQALAARADERSEDRLGAGVPALPPVPPVLVDPALTSSTLKPAAPPRSSYEPLPTDRASFEALVRDRASDPEFARLRAEWNQETALIPRASLAPTVGTAAGRHAAQLGTTRMLAIVSASTLAALLLFWLKPNLVAEEGASSITTTSLGAAPAAAATLIVTEPSGAELLSGGAVVGNTPSEVPRPLQGEELYTVRLTGFEPQLVRVTPHSDDAIRIMLIPKRRGDLASPLSTQGESAGRARPSTP